MRSNTLWLSIGLSLLIAACKPPNFIVIMVDDFTANDVEHIPLTLIQIADQGARMQLDVLYPLCMPSRASFLRGQYPHNHGIGEFGAKGAQTFFEEGLDQSTIATWMQTVGYRTGLVGHYMPGAGTTPVPEPEYIPPGWDEWFAFGEGVHGNGFNYTINHNGTLITYGSVESDYQTDVLRDEAIAFIEQAGQDQVPFFLLLSFAAPHDDIEPAPRHVGSVTGNAPRPPSFNEADPSDKPPNIQNLCPLTQTQINDIDARYQRRGGALKSVDEAVDAVMITLAATNQLGPTYIFFYTDNGFHQGEHCVPRNKFTPYEEARVAPMFIRGPGVISRDLSDYLIGVHDLAPTIAQLAGVPVPAMQIDGKSFRGLLKDAEPVAPETWRQRLFTSFRGLFGTSFRNFFGIRGRDFSFDILDSGALELYDLLSDPYQLDNLASDPAHADFIDEQLNYIEVFQNCTEQTCRDAEMN